MTVLLTDLANGVLTLTLNRPESLNALTGELLTALAEALGKAGKTADVRAVVLTGAGRGFTAGQDLKEIEGGSVSLRPVLKRYALVIKRIAELEKPVVAAVNGAAAGAGLSLALACDLRLASSEASFTTAFSRIALGPDSGMSYFLPRLVGWSKALELLALSPRILAEEALRLGLVNRVIPADAFPDEVRSFAVQLAQGPTRAFGLTKRALRKNTIATLDEALEYEAHLQEILRRGHDHREGVQAFLEKRLPTFNGT